MNIERLKKLRGEKSQQAIASDLGIDRTTYVKYEKGDISPGAKRLTQLANYFGVSIDYLMDNSDESGSDFGNEPDKAPDELLLKEDFELTPAEQELLALFRKLDDDMKKIALGQAKILSESNKK